MTGINGDFYLRLQLNAVETIKSIVVETRPDKVHLAADSAEHLKEEFAFAVKGYCESLISKYEYEIDKLTEEKEREEREKRRRPRRKHGPRGPEVN